MTDHDKRKIRAAVAYLNATVRLPSDGLEMLKLVTSAAERTIRIEECDDELLSRGKKITEQRDTIEILMEEVRMLRGNFDREKALTKDLNDVLADRNKQLENYKKLLDAIGEAGCSVRWDAKGVKVLNDAREEMRRRVTAALNTIASDETPPRSEWYVPKEEAPGRAYMDNG